MDVMTLGEAKKVKECCSLAGRCDGCPIVGTDFCAYVLAKHLATALEENEKLREVAKQAIEIMESFKYESDEDSPSYSYFEGRILEDHFFIVLNELKKLCGKE